MTPESVGKRACCLTRKPRRVRLATTATRIAALVAVLATMISVQATELKVMTYNIWVGGRLSGQPLSQTAAVIQAADADIVGLQEQSGSTQQLADMLGFHYHVQNGDIGYVSRFPISGMLPNGIEIQITEDLPAYLFNIHYAPYPYGPYDLRDNPALTAEDLIDTAERTRGAVNGAVLSTMRPFLDAGDPVFLLGDFNEPSHLDWTDEAAQADLHFGATVQWPTSLDIVEAGLLDSCRTIRPDEVNDPAETWTPGYPAPHLAADEVHDRIDIIYHAGFGLEVTDVAVVGEKADNADIVVTPYPSDHRAVVATYNVEPTPLLGDVTLDGRVDQADADIIVAHWLEEFPLPGAASHVNGDIDRNGAVNLRDVALFQRGLRENNPQAAVDWSNLGSSVPEPSSLTILCMAVLLFGIRRSGPEHRGARFQRAKKEIFGRLGD